MGFEHLLLVTGEIRRKWGWITFVVISLPCVNSLFTTDGSTAAGGDGIRRVKELGLDGVMVYQETYHEATYAATI